MALSASTGFRFRQSLIGLEHTARQRYLLAGSATVKIGDLVRINNAGLLVRAATGTAVLGVLDGIVDKNGANAFSDRASGTAGATLTEDDQIATASDNATLSSKNLKGEVIVDPAGVSLFYNDADDTLAQTNLLQMFDVANGNQVTVGGASESNGQVQLMAIDPDGDGDASKGLFRIHENQFGNGLDTATAKVEA